MHRHTDPHTHHPFYPPHGSEHHKKLPKPAKTAKDTIVALCLGSECRKRHSSSEGIHGLAAASAFSLPASRFTSHWSLIASIPHGTALTLFHRGSSLQLTELNEHPWPAEQQWKWCSLSSPFLNTTHNLFLMLCINVGRREFYRDG